MDMFEAFVEIQRKEAEKILNSLHKEDFLPAAQIIWDAEEKGNRLHITGIGKPSHVANYMASLLSSTGTPTYFLHGTEAVHGSCGQLVAGDVVICISNSGETAEMKATAMETLIVVTNGMMLFSRSIGASLMLNELNGFGEKHITRILKAAKDPQLKMILQNMPVYMTVDDVDNNMEPLIRATVVGGFFAHRVERLNRISLLTSKHRWIWRNDPCRP